MIFQNCRLPWRKTQGIAAIYFLFVLNAAIALPPTIVIGSFLETGAYRENNINSEIEPDAGISSYAGHRFLLGDSGYGVISGSLILSGIYSYISDQETLYDSEMIDAEISVPAGNGSIDMSGSLAASLLGGSDDGIITAPQWEIDYKHDRGRRKINPYIGYTGSIMNTEKGDSDYYSAGIKAGFNYRPRVENGYTLEAHGYREKYFELKLPDGSFREDFVFKVEAGFDGIASLFWNWEINPSAAYRESSQEGEDSIDVIFPCIINWSPDKNWSISLNSSIRPVFYTELDEYDLGFSTDIRIDRAVNEGIFLYIDTGLSVTSSPSADRDSWLMLIRGGIDLSL